MKTKVTFIADTHHFSPTLTDGGRSYELRSGSDQKCLLETGAIIDASFEFIANSDTEAVMVVGDVSDDGERVSHEEFREKCIKLAETKPVYIVTATHDWCCDENPRAYFGDGVSTDVPTIPHEELREFYYDFGPKQAIAEYITHLGLTSYVVDLSESVRLLAINDDQDGIGHSGYSEEHLQWIEEQIRKADEEGKVMLGMEHHLIMPHVHPLISGHGMTIGLRDERAARLADAGLKYMFVGHSHIHRISEIVTDKGNKIIQVNVGSLVGYPSAIVNVTVDGKDVSVETVCAPEFEFGGKQDTLTYLAKHGTDLIDNIIFSAAGKSRQEFVDRMNALGVRGDIVPKIYPVVKPFAKYLTKVRVSGGYRLLNTLTFGRVLDKKDAKELWDVPVLDIVHEVVLSLFGGTPDRKEPDSAYCRLVKQVASVPHFFVRKNELLSELPTIAELIVTGGKFDTKHCDLK